MPRPKTKDELLLISNSNFQQLLAFIDSLSESEKLKEFPKGTLNRKISDVLFHLHHWHLMMKEWYTIGMNGMKPEMPAKGYTWKTTPNLNQLIWKKYKNENLEEAISNLKISFNSIQQIINKHTNEELFEKKRYKWTGTTSMGSYLVSATSSHYDWALKLIKKAKRTSKK